MTESLVEIYRARVAQGEIEADAAQAAALAQFADLAEKLNSWSRSRGGFLSWVGRNKSAPPKGIYLHGAVGRGKTMLMDLFFGAARVTPKRRLHFHEFMAEAHDRIGAARKRVDGDPIPHVAAEIARGARLLCFDELHVTDIADAMILGRLFKSLFAADVVVVATSNAQPHELYKNGLNRQLFLPFIDLLRQHMEVAELDVSKDYRLEKLAGHKLYFSPVDGKAQAGIDALWDALTGRAEGEPATLEVKGRRVAVPLAAQGVARFQFADLCAKPLGSLDYLAIARAYHTVIVEDIPVLTPDKRNEARRFINLIDTLYDQRVGFIASAAAEPDSIYPAGDGVDLFARTASRLTEMRSQAYLEARTERMNMSRQSSEADVDVAADAAARPNS